jgi:hypothetical protein
MQPDRQRRASQRFRDLTRCLNYSSERLPRVDDSHTANKENNISGLQSFRSVRTSPTRASVRVNQAFERSDMSKQLHAKRDLLSQRLHTIINWLN